MCVSHNIVKILSNRKTLKSIAPKYLPSKDNQKTSIGITHIRKKNGFIDCKNLDTNS